jgi:general secretion pathway protein K
MTAHFGGNTRNRERGLALLVVLWGVTAAALLVSAFNVVARSGAIFMSSEIALTEAEALADAGLEIAAAHLIDDNKAQRWRADGKPRRLTLGDAELTIAIDDPNGLVDVNKAKREVLLGLLSRAMGDEDAAEAMVEQLLRMRGEGAAEANAAAPVAEQSAESSQATPAEPAATEPATTKPAAAKPRIPDITELRRMGMSPALYRKIAPHLTVYSRDGRINPFHAPRAVLAALPGLSEIDIDRFLDSKTPEGDDERPIPGSLGKAGAFLANKDGPAYIVSVAVGKPGRPRLLGRQFVIAAGLDANAPYRLLAIKPLSADSILLQDRTPQS